MKNNQSPIRRFICRMTLSTTALLSTCTALLAQSADTLAPYREFMTICTGYQHAPLQLKLHYLPATNLVLQPSDTAAMHGQFYLGQSGHYYLRLQDVEQLITDSLSLIINHSLKQVVLDTSTTNARRMLQRYIGSFLADTSVQRLAAVYTITQQPGTTAGWLLSSRSILIPTSLPRQSILLEYDPEKREPKRVVTTRHTLIPINPNDSAAFAARFAGEGNLLTVPGRGLYFIRQQQTVYSYEQLLHQEPALWPVRLEDYLLRKEDGSYEVLPSKTGYRLQED